MSKKPIIWSVLFVLVTALCINTKVFAADTGGYPWADATLINQKTYDWGFVRCRPEMKVADLCGKGHTVFRGGIRYYLSDPWHYDVRNCTSYAAWRVKIDLGIDIPRWGNATNWDNAAARLGYLVNQTPGIGSIAVWEGKLGHVAFVTAINNDGSVNVDQYNKRGTGQFSSQTNVRADKYIHVADKQPVPAPEVVVQTQPAVTPAAPVEPQPPVYKELQTLDALAEQSASLQKTEGIYYDVIPSTDHQRANVYAVQYMATHSNMVEVSRSNSLDQNTSWEKPWVSSLNAVKDDTMRFSFADYNQDSYTDLYVIQTDGSAKSQIKVMSGQDGFKDQIASWTIPGKSSEPAAEVQYTVSDYDGNGSVDLYVMTRRSTHTEVTVLSGSDGFAGVLSKGKQETPSVAVGAAFVADYDRDGRAELFTVSRSEQQQLIDIMTLKPGDDGALVPNWSIATQL